MTKQTKYSDNSIISLSPREFCRLRPATYLGSNEYSTQLVREIFANALDEHNIGHGNIIKIKIDTKANLYSVEDNGQGFPINILRDDGETVLQAAFDKLNTSGKYDSDGVYGASALGLNGIGSKLTNYLSKTLEVISYNGINYEHLWFIDGVFKKRDSGTWDKNTSGTIVKWSPDEQFFQNVEANKNDLDKLFDGISALCPQLTIEMQYDSDLKIYKSLNGLQDLANTKIKNKEILDKRFCIKKIVNDNLFDILLTYTNDYSETIIPYVNFGLTDSGVHISTLKAGLVRQINKYAIDNGFLKKNSIPLTQAELSEGLYIIFNIKANNVKYDSQTKTRIVDLDKTLLNDTINNDFKDWLNNNPRDTKIIIERALTARKAREAAQKAKDNVRNAKTKNKKFISLPTKLVDAYSKNRGDCELYLVEGDSAGSGLIAKRNGATQAIFPLRGKVLSVRKQTIDKIYANQEISNLVKALGLDIDKETGKLIYDIKKLRYGKIILAEDADPDGYQIRLLLINAIWWLCADLIINGHVWAAIPPLFRITTKKNKYIYLKDQKELNKYKEKHINEAYIINRNKGLGEMSPDELSECLLKENTRHIEQIVVDDINKADNMLEMAMGSDVTKRRDYLLANYSEVI